MSQKQLRRFLEVMVDNLVDSNVFMRSLVLSVEHSAFRQEFREDLAPRLANSTPSTADDGDGDGERKEGDEKDPGSDVDSDDDAADGLLGRREEFEPCYLGHTWYDVQPQEVALVAGAGGRSLTAPRDEVPAWGPTEGGANRGTEESKESSGPAGEEGPGSDRLEAMAAGAGSTARRVVEKGGGGVGYTRLQCFLKQNTPQLVRDLMSVVNLETINHENICCLNTAVLILIFSDRRGELAEVRREQALRVGCLCLFWKARRF